MAQVANVDGGTSRARAASAYVCQSVGLVVGWLEPTRVLTLTSAAFKNVVTTMPSVNHKMLIVLTARLRVLEAGYVPARERNAPSDLS